MPAAMIAQLVIALGPAALGLIKDLVALWSAPALTVDQVNAICDKAKTSYEDYIKAAQIKA
jgi:hypothetical protein